MIASLSQPQPMTLKLLLSLLLACASAQKDGGGGGTACDMCGASATYTETIPDNGRTRCDVGICKSGSIAKRNIVSNGCPNHYSVCTGKAGVVRGEVIAIGAEISISAAVEKLAGTVHC